MKKAVKYTFYVISTGHEKFFNSWKLYTPLPLMNMKTAIYEGVVDSIWLEVLLYPLNCSISK